MQFKSFEECVYSFTHFLYTGSILKSISIPEPLKITQTILMFIQCRHFFMENNRKAWWVEFTNTLGFVYLDYKNCCFCAVWMIKLSFILPTITYLHKQHVPFVITSPVYSKWLLLHKSTPHWLQVYVITMLKQHTQTLHKL